MLKMDNYSIPNSFYTVENQNHMYNAFYNQYVYYNQNPVPAAPHYPPNPLKVLVNPHFNKKVFVNPNYVNNQNAGVMKIHVNPKVAISIPPEKTANKIHVNPKILNNVKSLQDVNVKQSTYEEPKQKLTYLSRTKLSRVPLKEQSLKENKRVRRSSIYNKFKIVKSTTISKSPKNKIILNTKYKLKRENVTKQVKNSTPLKLKSRFKLDNRTRKISNVCQRNTKYVFVNRFLSISDIAKNIPLRRNKKLLNISGNLYKSSPNRLQKIIKKDETKLILINQNKLLSNTRFKLIRRSSKLGEKKKIVKATKYINKKRKVSREKLRKCNIPCPYYRKFGKCKGKDLGKCPRKHDPDQIALCTKFLQGACIDSKCLLSHNVSPEKMPTCKFYLEGSCSKDNCPYLHVRISPKADICKDFLEGFCKKATECDKRHQFLCPEFEKKGACLKTRCPYPHGRMVRKYSDYNKHKFAKKSSTNKSSVSITNNDKKLNNHKNVEPAEVNATTRYYADTKIESQISIESNKKDEVVMNQQINFRIRPQLGDLPSFISLEDK